MKSKKSPARTTRSWHRLALSLLGIAIVAAMWRWATFHLYALPEHSIAAFTSLTNNASYVIGAIVIFMVTGRLVYEWKNSTASSVIEQAQSTFEKRVDPKDVDSPEIA